MQEMKKQKEEIFYIKSQKNLQRQKKAITIVIISKIRQHL